MITVDLRSIEDDGTNLSTFHPLGQSLEGLLVTAPHHATQLLVHLTQHTKCGPDQLKTGRIDQINVKAIESTGIID